MMCSAEYQGILIIGDPHLEGRCPGFRKDDYAQTILDKLAWCLDYARQQTLLPILLGDLFDKPRDNPTWLVGQLLDLLQGEVIGLYGNHDCADPTLNDHDTLSLLIKAKRLRLVDYDAPWRGTMNGRPVVVGGSSYRAAIPRSFPVESARDGAAPLVVWLTHHDILIPGYDEGRVKPREIDGVDLVINGHIHRRLEDVAAGSTLWITPGNISRRTRGEASRVHVPAVLQIRVAPENYDRSYIVIPHRPFDEVFHAAEIDREVDSDPSSFVAGLAELQARRTESGAGLQSFLEQNLPQYPPPVASEIWQLAMETTTNADTPR